MRKSNFGNKFYNKHKRKVDKKLGKYFNYIQRNWSREVTQEEWDKIFGKKDRKVKNEEQKRNKETIQLITEDNVLGLILPIECVAFERNDKVRYNNKDYIVDTLQRYDSVVFVGLRDDENE